MPTFSNNTGSEAVAGSVTVPKAATISGRGSNAGQSESVVRSAGVVSVAVLMSRVTGLLRESLMARLFGAGLIYDAFMLGFRIPNLTRDLFAEGAMSAAFVTAYLSPTILRNRAISSGGSGGVDDFAIFMTNS